MTPINFKVYKTIELDSTDSLKIKHYDICIYDSKNNFLLQIINEVIYDQYFDYQVNMNSMYCKLSNPLFEQRFWNRIL